MTLIIKMKQSINNPNAPLITLYDPIESRTGSLFLWDAQRNPLDAAPIVGSTIPNLLNDYPVATGKTMSFIGGSMSASEHDSYLATQLSAKKGIHFIASQARTIDITGSDTLFHGIGADSALLAAIYNNVSSSNKKLYVSIWERVTRISGVGVAPLFKYMGLDSSTTSYAAYLATNKALTSVAAGSKASSKLNLNYLDSNIVGAQNVQQFSIESIAGTGISAVNTPFKLVNGKDAPWSGTAAGAQALNNSPSRIIYRIYIEDLNLSGRTYEQVKAIDDAEFNKAFAAGGRFYGDTWSDPATLLP